MTIEVRHPVNPPAAPAWASVASMDFEAASSMSLSMSDANFGAYNRDKFSFSVWFHCESVSNGDAIAGHGNTFAANAAWDLSFQFNTTSTQITFRTSSGGTTWDGQLSTTAQFSDTASWHHLKVDFDSSAAAGDRMKMTLDGTEVTAFAVDLNPPASPVFNTTESMLIGKIGSGSDEFDGNLAQPAFFSGANPVVTSLITGTPGSPKDLTGLTGLWSWIENVLDVVTDSVLVAAWTNNNVVVRDTGDFPA